ncbi:MAG: hypothetical protein A3K67_06460 [Euryarchaeota archaeon RBG_16_62_10]|nr:MAG: hypothetical protein A3K67_06460 [Euryarchaeota archaeon RBG_16_62_10]
MSIHHANENNPAFTLGHWSVKPGSEKEFIGEWTAFAKWTIEHQPGVMGGRLLQETDRPGWFVSIGHWRDMESVESWRRTPEFEEFLAKVKGLCVEITTQTMRPVAHVHAH